MTRLLGRFFKRFTTGFARAGDGYSRALGITMRHGAVALAIYGGLILLTWFGFNSVPAGFIPAMDKQYLVAVAQLPPAASLDRTEAVTRRIAQIALKQPGVAHAVEFAGMSVNGFTQSSSASLIFFPLDDFSQRTSKTLSGPAIAAALNQKRSEEHTSELQSPCNLVCRLLLEKKKKKVYDCIHNIHNFSAIMTNKLRCRLVEI